MTEKIALRVQHKRMTKEDWLKSDAILLEGEIGVESDTGYIKAGNGTDYFPDLPYLSGPPGIIVKGQFDYLEDLKNTYPTGNFGEGYQIKNEDKTVYAWGERHATKSASGNAITLEDSATANLKGLRLYGRSWQDGEPSIEEPKEIHSVENVKVELCGKNIMRNIVTYPMYGTTIKYEKFEDYVVITPNREGGGVFAWSSGWVSIPMDKIISNGRYTVSFDVKLIKQGEFSDKIRIDTWLGKSHRVGTVVTTTTDYTNVTCVLTKPFDTITLAINANVIEVKNFQLELGDNDTEFESYQSGGSLTIPYELNAVPVNNGGNYTDETGQQWVADYVDFDRGVLVRNAKKVTKTIKPTNSFLAINKTRDLGLHNVTFGKVSVLTTFKGLTRGTDCSNPKLPNIDIYNIGADALSEPINVNVLVPYPNSKESYQTIPLSDSELQAYAKLHTLYPYTTILNDQGVYMEVDYQSTEVEGEWLDVGKFHTNTNDVTQLQADILMKANKRDLVDDVPRINELEGKIKELSSKIDRIVANGT